MQADLCRFGVLGYILWFPIYKLTVLYHYVNKIRVMNREKWLLCYINLLGNEAPSSQDFSLTFL